jgi:aryl-alcohol dehydrogenase-like predicted oxidoreductase
VRGGEPIGPATLRAALEGSLRRLGTDVIDLYQLHWPNRGSYHFRKHWAYAPETSRATSTSEFLAILETLGAFVAEGKIRHVGVSNETAWGTARLPPPRRAPRAAAHGGDPERILADLPDVRHRPRRALRTTRRSGCSPSRRWRRGCSPASISAARGRRARGRRSTRRSAGGSPARLAPVAAYVALAREHGLDPAQMALAFAAERPFMASVILGATSLEQLRTDLGAAELRLSEAVREGIAAIRRRHPMPL